MTSRVKLLILYLIVNRALIGGEKWSLKWHEKFDSHQLDYKWRSAVYHHQQQNGKVCCVNEPIRLKRGIALTISKNEHEMNNNTDKCFVNVTGIQTTMGMSYGKFEINASVQYNTALARIRLSPVFHTYGKDREISGVIVIFAHNNQFKQTSHSDTAFAIDYGLGKSDKNWGGLVAEEEERVKHGFHLIAFEWTKQYMIWKLDDKLQFKVNTDQYFFVSKEMVRYSEKGQPFDQQFRLELYNDFYVPIKPTQFDKLFTKSAFIIDSIKYYDWIEPEKVSINNHTVCNHTTDDNTNSDENASQPIVTSSLICLVLVLQLIITIILISMFYRVTKEKAVLVPEQPSCAVKPIGFFREP